jgi:hypothetical protein
MTTFQTAVRDNLAARASDWRSLTQAQRDAWANLGGQIVRTDSLGNTYTLTGFLAYLMANRNRATLGLAAISDAPAIPAIPQLVGVALSAINAIGDTLELSWTSGALGADFSIIVHATPGVSDGINFMARGRYKLITTDTTGTSPLNLLTAYTTRLGTFPPVGTRIFVMAQVVHEASGIAGPPIVVFDDVSAV